MTEPGVGAPGRVAVIGLGNVLMGDDALGPYAVRVLQAMYEFPPGVSVTDAGTDSISPPTSSGSGALIVIDTVKADSPPSTLKLYRRDSCSPSRRRRACRTTRRRRRCCCSSSGAMPRDVLAVNHPQRRPGRRPDASGSAALPAVERAVLDELSRLGCPARLARAAIPTSGGRNRPTGEAIADQARGSGAPSRSKMSSSVEAELHGRGDLPVKFLVGSVGSAAAATLMQVSLSSGAGTSLGEPWRGGARDVAAVRH
jgi:hydrogenase maturation protease